MTPEQAQRMEENCRKFRENHKSIAEREQLLNLLAHHKKTNAIRIQSTNDFNDIILPTSLSRKCYEAIESIIRDDIEAFKTANNNLPSLPE